MEYNEDHLSGQVFAETLTVLGWTRMVGCRRKYLIKCSECAKDPEVFGDGLFETSKESLDRGYKPCGCGHAYKWSEEQSTIRIKRKASELGVNFVGFREPYTGVQTRCIMSCNEGEWFPTINNFISKGQIKFNRGKSRGNDEDIIQKFFDTGVFHENTKFSRHRYNDKWYWKVECPVCNEFGISQPQHLQRGCRPCRCGNYKQKFSYIHGVFDGDMLIAVKFGITRSKDLRIKYQSRETVYDLRSLGVWEYSDKFSCVAAERMCCSDLVCGILAKEEFGDGYTETTYPHNLGKIVKIYEDYGGVKIE